MTLTRYPSRIIKRCKDPIWWRNRILNNILIPILFKENKGTYILKESWDNLIILDACRFDVFNEIYQSYIQKGHLECRITRGAHTTLFLLENFRTEKNNDIVYISANPHVEKLLKGKFYKIISVWKDGWNETYQTILPKTMYEYSLDAIRTYPDKRLIIHFIQPHYPYIGYKINDDSFAGVRKSLLKGSDCGVKRKYKDTVFSVYGSDIYAMIDTKTHFKAYKENLKKVLPYVNKLIDLLPGRTVVTSDHGEAFGEKICPLLPIRLYGHIDRKLIGIRIPSIVNVPWLVVEPEEKKSPQNIEHEFDIIQEKFADRDREKLKKAITKLKRKGRI